MDNTGIRRYSIVWKYFKVKDEHNFIATCNGCHNDYSYRTSTTNLSKHWQKKHGELVDVESNDASDTSSNHSDNEDTDDQTVTKSKPNTSPTWHYFDIIDGNKYTARCKICDKDVSYDSISELTEHVKDNHAVTVSEDEQPKVSDERKLISLSSQRRLTSHVWRYMQAVDGRNAICRLCNKKLSYLTTVSNLKKHMQRAHPQVKLDINDKTDQKVIISTDGQLYEVQNSDPEKDPISTKELYLEDIVDDNSVDNSIDHFETVTTTSPLKENDKKSKKQEKMTHKRELPKEVYQSNSKNHSSSEEVPAKKTKSLATLEIFGQYVISLLSQLPENVCDQLQSEIIKQIFLAKVALNTPNVITINDKPVTITLYKGTGSNMPEITVGNSDGAQMAENND